MKTALSALALLALSVAPAASAAASRAAPDALAVQAMHNFGACIVDRTRPGAERVLAMDFRTPAYGKAMRALAKGHDACAWNSRLAFSPLLLNGAMAERIIANDHATARLPTALAARPEADPATPQARDLMERVALCTVRRAPESVAALLASAPTEKEEEQAFQALGQPLIGCVPAGKPVKLNRPGLRAILSLAAYRLLYETSPAGNGNA